MKSKLDGWNEICSEKARRRWKGAKSRQISSVTRFLVVYSDTSFSTQSIPRCLFALFDSFQGSSRGTLKNQKERKQPEQSRKAGSICFHLSFFPLFRFSLKNNRQHFFLISYHCSYTDSPWYSNTCTNLQATRCW